MIRVRGPVEARRIDDPDIRGLVERRYAEICNDEPYDPEIHGEMVVVEPGDTLASLEEETGLPIATNPFDECRFPHPEFIPVCEHLEKHAGVHAGVYAMTFILTDDGAGTILFIPRQQGIDADLLALCERFAEPVFEPTSP